MRYQQDLQVGLRDRFRRLMTARHDTYSHETGLVISWISAQAPLRSVLTDIETAPAEGDFDAWMAQMGDHGGMSWASRTEKGRAQHIWRLMQALAADENLPRQIAWRVSHEKNANDAVRSFTEIAIMPFFDYLGEHVGAESSVLYLMQRYAAKVEWFDRDDLHARYESDTRQGEKVYDDHLRRFLFDQGLDMPFSQAKSASGLSDVLADLDTDDPLVCEVKVFDAAGHDKRGIVSGVHQVVHYATDFGKATAYLVIINLSGRVLELPTDGPEKLTPPYVDVGGVRVHLIAVRALPTASASKLGKARPVTITRENLIDPDSID